MAPGAATRIEELLGRPGIEPSERRILLAHALGLTRVDLVRRSREPVNDEALAAYQALLERRSAGEPIAYLTGTREFYGRPFRTTPAVLIPRPETELLVDLALERIGARHGVTVLDLGSGSGALAITLALECPHCRVTALDDSRAALALARASAADLGAAVNWVESDWFEQLAPARFDLIVCNPPYIASGDPHLDQGDLRFEPRHALSDGADGLSALARVIRAAPAWLDANGWLLVEHGYDQAEPVAALFGENGYRQRGAWRDLGGLPRVAGGAAPARRPSETA